MSQAQRKTSTALGIRVNGVCPGYVRTAMQQRELQWKGALCNMAAVAVRAQFDVGNPPYKRKS